MIRSAIPSRWIKKARLAAARRGGAAKKTDRILLVRHVWRQVEAG